MRLFESGEISIPEEDYEVDDFVVPDDKPLSQHDYDDVLGDVDPDAKENEKEIVNYEESDSDEGTISSSKLNISFMVVLLYNIKCLTDKIFYETRNQAEVKEYYGNHIRKINKNICSKKESLLSSSSWSQEFINNLKSLPYISTTEYEFSDLGYCQVCNRTNHYSTYEATFSGVIYNSDTFWEGLIIDNPKQGEKEDVVKYKMGKFCFKKTTLYHRLHHYKFRLIDLIKEKIESMKGLANDEIEAKLMSDKEWYTALFDDYLDDIAKVDVFFEEDDKEE